MYTNSQIRTARVAFLTAFAMMLAVLALFLPAKPASASVVQIEPHTHQTSKLRVTYAERLRGGRLYVELNNGATFRFGPCVEEDSPNCWWDAETAGIPGSGGHSFVDLKGRVLYLDGVRF